MQSETVTSDMIRVAQVVDGDATCECGASAVLDVRTEPDDLPGLVCYEHARPWIGATVDLIDKLFGNAA